VIRESGLTIIILELELEERIEGLGTR